jgi:hypothetical protein
MEISISRAEKAKAHHIHTLMCVLFLCRRDNQWKWVYDPVTKQGKWELAGGADSATKHTGIGSESAQSKRTKVTMEQLEDEARKLADEKARQLRRENALRAKVREEQKLKAEREEQERIKAALEVRRREIEEKRSLITAGPRVKPLEVFFDDVSILV